MVQELLTQNEGKTLEFKENALSLSNIIKTIVAFANTAGGTIVIGVQDQTKILVGINNPLKEEERITSAIADSIEPLLRPDIEVQTYRDKVLLLIHVPHIAGPYYIKAGGPESGVYVRFGSTNRLADRETVRSLRDYARHIYFDETPYIQGAIEQLDWDAIKNIFHQVDRKITKPHAENLGLICSHGNKKLPTYGGILLFGLDRAKLFPDAIIRCARFLGHDKTTFLDQLDIASYPPLAIEKVLNFVRRNTMMGAEITELRRKDIPQYPVVAVREAITNAVVHADYTIGGISIKVAVYNDRIEITNPGTLPYGLRLENAILGSSRIRNRTLGKVFRELKLVEHWGSGLRRIIDACEKHGLKTPRFEEIDNQFKVTLYAGKAHKKRGRRRK